ncbi:Hypothetical predicted protein [Paramuricea clavata]|uniref:Uncharacterized protein n=1 Tax=Paramuricea clavata TaxID=317549 RepID=A0A6S7KKN2_PARCT|nr:Hypothetical predicted protein [Paramuricea clavata]
MDDGRRPWTIWTSIVQVLLEETKKKKQLQTDSMNDLPAKVNLDSHRFHFNVTYYKEVLGVLKSISASKAAGLDNIPPKLVKDAAEELATSFTTLVNRSLTCGLFPTAEKAAKYHQFISLKIKRLLTTTDPFQCYQCFQKYWKESSIIACHTTLRKTIFLKIPSMDFVKSGQPSTP